jgi:pseudouridine kinase
MRIQVACIGGATIDRTYRAGASLQPGTSNPVRSEPRSMGGVARNVAESLARLGAATMLVSIVGDDENGRAVLAGLNALGIAVDHVAIGREHRTAEYVAVLEPTGDLAFGLADMAILDAFSVQHLDRAWSSLAEAAWVFADCNLPADVLAELIGRTRRGASFKLAVDAVSARKALRLPEHLAGIDLLFLNEDEARARLGAGVERDGSVEHLGCALMERGASSVVLTLGARGALVAQGSAAPVILPAARAEILDVTGAGDALIAATLDRLLGGAALDNAVRAGLVAASLTIEARASVRPDLSSALLASAMRRVPYGPQSSEAP